MITLDVAAHLARHRPNLRPHIELLAPTLLRSQLLTHFYALVGDSTISETDAIAHLDHIRSLRIRYLGDRVLHRVAWKFASDQGWHDTYDAEYVALTILQADALATDEPRLRAALDGIVQVATITELLADEAHTSTRSTTDDDQ